MIVHEELIYQFATTEDTQEAYELLMLLAAYYLTIYDNEVSSFAKANNVNLDLADNYIRSDYALYITDILSEMRERVKEKETKLSGLAEAAFLLEVYGYVESQYKTIEASEFGNAKQLAQLHVVNTLQKYNSAVRITKRWNAHPDCCDLCRALDGTEKPINEPFLINGQVVELSNGEEFIYNYIDRSVAIAHPNDRCWIEFIIEF